MNNTTKTSNERGRKMGRNEVETKVLEGMTKVREMQYRGELNLGMIYAEQVGRASGLDTKTTKNALKRLERKGKVSSVTLKGRHKRGGFKVTTYRILNG